MAEASNSRANLPAPWVIARGGLAALSQLSIPVWLGWAVFAIFDGGLRYVAWTNGVIGHHHTEKSLRYALWLLATGLGMALISGPTFRLLAGSESTGIWRPDRGFLAYLLIIVTSVMAPFGLSLLLPTAVRGDMGLGAALVVLLGSLIGLAAYLALLIVELRLFLWPFGMLLGDRTMTAARAWNLTRGHALRFLVAFVLAEFVSGIAVVLCASKFLDHGGLIPLALQEALIVVNSILGIGVVATVYKQLRPNS